MPAPSADCELHDANGRIQLPGFYHRVRPVTNAPRAQWDALGFDESGFLGGSGLTTPVGERGFSALERLWVRPTADIKGIWGDSIGPGSKTVIAAQLPAGAAAAAGDHPPPAHR